MLHGIRKSYHTSNKLNNGKDVDEKQELLHIIDCDTN